MNDSCRLCEWGRIWQTGRVQVILADIVPKEMPKPRAERHFAELSRLVTTLGGMSVVKIIQRRGRPSGKTYLGTGKAVEVGAEAKALKADAVVINGILKGGQLHELKKCIAVPVYDRVDIILKIFERHARTEEAKLQILRARLAYDIPKIYRRDATTLFERERGGGVVQRGSGETGIEAEKRHLREHIRRIDVKLANLVAARANQRARRKKAGLTTIALAGYTNAGKSALLSALSGKKVLVEDKLFSTLDTRLGGVWLPELRQKVLVADTIGFIEHLPPDLVEAFAATLEEVRDADVILHVFDGSETAREIARKQRTVEDVLRKLGASEVPRLLVASKEDVREALGKKRAPKADVRVSSVTGAGLPALKALIEGVLKKPC